ncbi:MAG: glucose 1-dehydrogenase [Sphingomonadaceae bacterium]|nr:glucose 1-dehydrogenase [Sphingomonadaceae bacterium]
MPTVSLAGRTAIITGGARGIGGTIARHFAECGANVFVTDILTAEGEALCLEIGNAAAFLRQDVRSEEDWDAAFAACAETFGTPDILVNNAGIEVTSFIAHADVEDLRRLFDVNVIGTAIGVKKAFAVMGKAAGGKGGAVLNLSSMSALIASPGFGPYGATKSAVERLTKVAAVEAGALETGLRINCLYPGIIATDMQQKLQDDLIAMGVFPDAQAVGEFVLSKTPLRRLGSPEDVAKAAAYLCSDYADFITGVGLPVDGGMALG